MLVFGEHTRLQPARAEARELDRRLYEIAAQPPGLARHGELVSAFIDAGELAQGIADAEMFDTDRRAPVSEVAMTLLVELAREVAASWRSSFVHRPAVPRSLHTLLVLPLPPMIRLRRAEGHAYYAVYPEAYLAAATTAATRQPGPRQVIGIRSIGTGLSAIVAAAIGAPIPTTVRPRGEAYRRRLHVAPALADEWTRDPYSTFAIVDEGPGASGISFGVVADALEDRGIAADRIECFPSHAGELGPTATERHRARWPKLRRHVVEVDELLVHTDLLASWISELVGPLLGPLEDLSAGAWRAHRFVDERGWPASVTFQERRKFLARTSSSAWLARFVGLGATGARALERGRTLHSAGMTPQIAGMCHGFLVERWHDDAVPLDPRLHDRTRLIEHVGRYLGLLARRFPASHAGASLDKLLEMARHNTALALGSSSTALFDRFGSRLAHLEKSVRPIEIDGRLHAWEWLVRGDGSLLKTDALDHHASHDLVGCQDVTWDLAGAAAELALTGPEQRRLAAAVSTHGGRSHDPDLLRMMRPCYLAFQLGRHALAIGATSHGEALRLRALVDRYATQLAAALSG